MTNTAKFYGRLFLIVILSAVLVYGAKTLHINASALELQNPTRAKVVKIIDGDTLDVLVDHETIRVRLLGIDAPERGRPLYAEAKEFLATRAGRLVYLESDTEAKDNYGRYLFWLFDEKGQLINAELVREGLADVFLRPSFRGRKHASELLHSALKACAEKKGVWSSDYLRVKTTALSYKKGRAFLKG